MLRWSVFPAALLGVMVAALSGMAWSGRITVERFEDVRLIRAQLQILEQQRSLLQSVDINSLVDSLQEDMDALQIRLVEVMTQQPHPAGVLQVAYEQRLLPQELNDDAGLPIRILRLEINLTVRHSIGLLNMFDRIAHAVGPWPHETRACDMQRLAPLNLAARCVVDFYHWSESTRETTVQAGWIGSGQKA